MMSFLKNSALIMMIVCFASCGSYLIIDSDGYRVPIKIEQEDRRQEVIRSRDTSLGNYDDIQRVFKLDKKFHSFFQSRGKFKIKDQFEKVNKDNVPLTHMVITTSFSLWDNILAMIPFHTRRTITIRADYGQWSKDPK